MRVRALLIASSIVASLDLAGSAVWAEEPPLETLPKLQPTTAPDPYAAEIGDIYVAEYRVRGSKLLSATEVGEAVYPYLGPARKESHIEQARVALEKAYHEKGYQSVSVSVPAQSGARGIIFLEVTEAKVGTLRVHGARYFLPSRIKRLAKSLAPGTVPNFNEVQKDLIRLNSSADMRVKPSLDLGVEPGTVDIDLTVEDKLPLHGSLELNNRYAANTVPLRLSGSLSYSHLWGLGHTIGGSFQVAPEEPDDATIYSAFYSLPFDQNLSLMLSGMKQDSDVSTLGGAAVVGRGEIYGFRFNWTLPQGEKYFHTLSAGMDYKHFDENVTFAGQLSSVPIDYYPMQVAYYGASRAEKAFTEGNFSINWHTLGMGSSVESFDRKRYRADGAFFYVRGDLAHTQDLPGGFQVMAKVQGQHSVYPLINTEQVAGGGLSNVRGYLESAALGDSGYFGTLELRSPSFLKTWSEKRHPKENPLEEARDEWRVYAFMEGGRLFMNDPLPDQEDRFELASYGFGTRVKIGNHFHGSLDASVPILTLGETLKDELFVSFRLWTDF